MSNSKMVADVEEEKRLDSRTIPPISSSNCKKSIERFENYLRGKGRAHLGLLPRVPAPVRPEGGDGSNAVRAWKTEKKEWKEENDIYEIRRDKAMSDLYLATSVDPLVDQVHALYTETCKAKENPADREPDPKELLDILLEHFEKKAQYKYQEVKDMYDNHKVKHGESLKTANSRFNEIIMKLRAMGKEPNEEDKKLQLNKSMENGEEKRLEFIKALIAMKKDEESLLDRMESMNQWQTNQTINDEAKEKKSGDESVNQIVANCTFCGIDGHKVEQCRKKKSNAAWHAKNKGKGGKKGGKKGGGRGGGNYRSFAGRGGDGKGKNSNKGGNRKEEEMKKTTTWQAEGENGEKSEDDKNSRKRDRVDNKNYSGCFKCGDYYHKAADCTASASRVKKYQRWEQHMIVKGDMEKLWQEAPEVHYNSRVVTPVFLDTCCSSAMFIVTGEMEAQLTNMKAQDWQIGLTDGDKSMAVTQQGDINEWTDLLLCSSARRNIAGTSKLREMGYGLDSGFNSVVYNLMTREPVHVCKLLNGMPWMPIDLLLALPKIDTSAREVHMTRQLELHPPRDVRMAAKDAAKLGGSHQPQKADKVVRAEYLHKIAQDEEHDRWMAMTAAERKSESDESAVSAGESSVSNTEDMGDGFFPHQPDDMGEAYDSDGKYMEDC